MKKRSWAYRSALGYKLLILLTHRKNLGDRYKYMASQIGPEMDVFEPGAGPGIIPPYLREGCTYSGFDLNPEFVKDAKRRGLKIILGNMNDAKSYKKCDVVLLVDVIHHLNLENQKKLLKNSLKVARKKIIVCEPFQHTIAGLNMVPGLANFQKKLFNAIEMDGNNEANFDLVHSKEQLRKSMKEGFGVVPKNAKRTVKEMGDDLIVTYSL